MKSEGSDITGHESVDQRLAAALPKLTLAQIAEVSPKLVRERFEPGEVIVRQGDPPDRFYIVLSGQVEVWHENLRGEVELVASRTPGGFFGETGLLQDRQRNATVQAAEQEAVEVLAMERADFQELIDKSRATEMHLAQEMIRRLIALAEAQD